MMRVKLALATLSLLIVGCGSLPPAYQPPPPVRAPDVIYVPTRQEVVEEMLRVAEVKPGDVVLDLGCGDGRIPITAAQKFGARGIGVDIDPTRISEARYNAERAGVADKTTFRIEDLFETDVREATVVTLYLLPQMNIALKPKLLRDLKPGSRIVAHDFTLGTDWPPEKSIRMGNDWIYFWTVPERKS